MGTRGVPPPVVSLETDEMGMDPPQSGFEPDYLHMFDFFFLIQKISFGTAVTALGSSTQEKQESTI